MFGKLKDKLKSALSVFSKKGKFQGTFGKGTLHYPRDIVIDSKGRFYVSDFGNKVIRVFIQL